MKTLAIPGLVLLSALTLAGCDSNNSNVTQQDIDRAFDQAAANTAVARTQAVIDGSNNVNTDAPESIDQVSLPLANTAEPVTVTGANSSL